MKILRRYIGHGFLLTFFFTLMVVTFVMSIGIVFKVTDLLAQGVAWKPMVRILFFGFPQALALAIPVSTLTACLLLFGRLSADGEITAMKANGVSIWQVISGPAAYAFLLSLVCLFMNSIVVPECHFKRRAEQSSLGVASAAEFIDAGRWITEFPDVEVYIERKEGEILRNIRVYDVRNPDVSREIRASSGQIQTSQISSSITVELQDVRVIESPKNRKAFTVYSKRWPLKIDLPSRRGTYRKKTDDFTLRELHQQIGNMDEAYPHFNAEDRERKRSTLRVELHKRLALSAACFSFVVLGIPLGIRAHRKESSIGIGLSLILIFNFYIFLILAESLDKHPDWMPHLLNWVPVVLSLVLGYFLVRRLE